MIRKLITLCDIFLKFEEEITIETFPFRISEKIEGFLIRMFAVSEDSEGKEGTVASCWLIFLIFSFSGFSSRLFKLLIRASWLIFEQ